MDVRGAESSDGAEDREFFSSAISAEAARNDTDRVGTFGYSALIVQNGFSGSKSLRQHLGSARRLLGV
jgi:hypothetical protein